MAQMCTTQTYHSNVLLTFSWKWLLLLGLAFITETEAQYLVEILEVKNVSEKEQIRRPVVRCDATGASFGEDVMTFSYGLQTIGCALPTKPSKACSEVTIPDYNKTMCSVNFAVVPRGNCSFAEKAFYAQFAEPTGYQAIIVYNDPQQAPIPMAGEHEFADKVQIPVVMVTYACMENLLYKYKADRGYVVTIRASPGYYDLIKYLVPFVAIVGFCFIVLFISLVGSSIVTTRMQVNETQKFQVIRLCRERRRLARKRLSRSNLKKIPTKKFKKGDPEETCAICLEDFQETEKLRVLPCRHAYHCKCVDPWLTKSRKVCPVCKRKVGPSHGSDSSDSDSERATTSTYNPTVARENDLLLRNAQPMAMSSSSAEFFMQPASTSHSGSANPQNDVENNDSGSVLMRASSFLNLHSPYPPPLSQQPSTSGSLRDDRANIGRALRTGLSRVQSRIYDLFQRGEQRLRGVGGSGSGSNTLLVDNVDYGDSEPDNNNMDYNNPVSTPTEGATVQSTPAAIDPADPVQQERTTSVDTPILNGSTEFRPN